MTDRVKQVSGTLIIKEAKVEDSGKYLCVVNNSVGGESVETVLTVTAPLSAKVEPQTQIVDFGRPAVLTCSYEGNPVRTVSWLKDGKNLNHEESVLRIDAVKKDDRGMYQCFIRNDQESAQAIAEIKLGGRFEPPQFRHTFTEETLQPGPSVFLKCVASGNPTPEITWELDGKKLSNNDRLQVGQYVTVNGDVVSHLNISSVLTNDGGLYRCVASSKVGSTEHSARLNVYGLPFIRPMEKKAIVAGENLFVTCPVAGYPIENIVWERDGRVLPINRKQKVFPNGTLIIENVERQSDQATYTCVARNAQGYSARGTLEVQVMGSALSHNLNKHVRQIEIAISNTLVPPEIQPFTFGERPRSAGQSISVHCAIVDGDRPVAISWLLDGSPVSPHMRMTAVSLGDSGSVLAIPSLTGDHAGVVACVASNIAGTSEHSAELKVNVPPQILPFLFGEESVNAGDVAAVQCTVLKGDFPIQIIWLFNDTEVNNIDGVFVSKSSKRVAALTIEAVRAFHAGAYTCVARNAAGTANHTAILRVNALPFIMPFEFGDAASAGDTVQLTCHVTKGDPPINIEWYFDGKPIAPHMGITLSKIGQRAYFLAISEVRQFHRGRYTCLATNQAGTAAFAADLHVNVAPQIMPFTFGEDSVNAGDFVTTQCAVVKGDSPISITWIFNGSEITSGNGILITQSGKRVSAMTIEAIREYNSGDYTCVARNAAGAANHTANIHVNVMPHIKPFEFDEPASAGDTVTLTCHVAKGDQPLRVDWYFDGKPILPHHGIATSMVGHRASFLSISFVRPHHRGRYTCLASNSAGTAAFAADLHVNVLPHLMPISFIEETANAGDFTTVACAIVKGDSPVSIIWFFNDTEVEVGLDGVVISQSKRLSTLSIESVRAEHAGSYTCVAKNAAGAVNQTAFLQVKVKTQILAFSFGEETVNAGDFATVQCAVVKGDSPVAVVWLFNGSEAENFEGINIMRSGARSKVLNIEAVRAEHSGVYTCVARNAAGATNHSAYLHVNVLPQIQPFSFGTEIVNDGDTSAVSCVVIKGDSPVIISWLFNDTEIDPSQGVNVFKTGARASSLNIEMVRAYHSGGYTCLARNAAGSANHTAVLHVNVLPQMLPFTFGEESVNAGDSSTVSCAVIKGDSPIAISWLFNETEIDPSQGVKVFPVGAKASSLSIDTVQAHHSGGYTCLARNAAGVTNYTAYLHVNVLPYITPFEFEGPVNAGETAQLTCHVTKGDPPLSIKWYHNGEPIAPHLGVVTGMFGQRTMLLSIPLVRPFHAGRYTCLSTNQAGTAAYAADLRVNVIPQLLPFSFGEEIANAGEMTAATCTVIKGDSPISIMWLFNETEISTNDGILITKTGTRMSSMSIESVRAEHSGAYTCVARNSAGAANYTSYLQVNVLPHIKPFEFEGAVNAGETVQLTCHVTKGDTPLNIAWYFDGKNLLPHLGIITSMFGVRANFLSIQSVRQSHAGRYTCLATNEAGTAAFAADLHINVVPQILPFTFGEEVVNAGDMTALQCTVIKGDSPISISWLFNNTELISNDGRLVRKMGSRISSLSIESVRAEHSGAYTCLARNAAGTTNHTAFLHVNVIPQLVPFTFGEESVNAGDMTAVTCTVVKGDSPISIVWLFNETEITSGEGIIISKTGTRLSSLSIESVKAEHSGAYTCVARNAAGAANFTSYLHVNVIPHIATFEFEGPASAGDAAQVACHVTKGDRPLTISWYFDGKPLAPHMGVLSTLIGHRASFLSIPEVRPHHRGRYTCLASNQAGTAAFAADLHVNVLPQIFPFEFGEESVNAGDVVAVQCTVTKGDSPLTITWHFNGSEIMSGDDGGVAVGKTGSRISSLSIEAVRAHHSGAYTCVARNAAGTSNHTSYLHVNVLPYITAFEFDGPASAGDTVQVSCNVPRGDKPLSISWLLHGEPVSTRQGITSLPVGERANFLSISYVSERHAGNYTCRASNPAGFAEHVAELRVNAPPLLLPFSFGERAMSSGSVVAVPCAVIGGDHPVHVHWLHNGHLIKHRSDVTSLPLGEAGAFLSIPSVHARHAGTYTCVAKNRAGIAEFSAMLNITVLPQILPFSFGDEFTNSGDVVMVSCVVQKGDTPLDITWYFEGEIIPRDLQVIMASPSQRISTLTITAVTAEHAGEYACRATNPAGTTSSTSQLKSHLRLHRSHLERNHSMLEKQLLCNVPCLMEITLL
ncbi:hypothetical protein B566_EDAN018819 [Ephemera danica]|nr:hypothetical protein B566_EDAN018819 [Ephemera danica]